MLRRSFSAFSSGPLDGIRVLDLTRVLAGPYCTQMLGDLGADVIKVELPGKGDDTRSWGPPFAGSESGSASGSESGSASESAYFLGVNRNKRSITINLKSSSGIDIVKKLALSSDILVENYLPGKLDELGLGYDALSDINPRLIYASISGYGPDGPFAKQPGYDVIVEAEAGLMHITGEPDGSPVKVGVAMTDVSTGLYAKGAILASLFQRVRTNRGEKIDVSLLESQVANLVNVGSNYLIGGQEGQRHGTAHASIVPYQAFETKDGKIVIGAGNNGQFAKLCHALKRPDLIQHPDYITNQDRVTNRITLLAAISSITKTKSTLEWIQILTPIGIPFGPINSIQQTFEHPQVIHRKMIHEIHHPTCGPIKLTGIPVKYSASVPSIRRAPPTLGQHTHEILSELGYSSSQISDLAASKAI